MQRRRKSIHFNGSNENIELLLRTVISASLSIYGAAAYLCNEAPKDFRALGKPVVSIGENSTDAQQRRNLSEEYERSFEQL